MRTRVKVASGVLGGGLLLASGVAIGSLSNDPGPTRSATDAAASSATALVSPADHGQIAAGEGGSSLAADGQTPVGFESSCVGAVQAAAAYAVATQNPTTGTNLGTGNADPGQARGGLEETLNRIMVGDDDSLEQLRQSAVPNNLVPGWSVDPAQGGYKVVECTAGKRAVVSLFVCETYNEYPGAYAEYEGFSSCGTGTWFVSWGGDPQDWRVASKRSGGAEIVDLTPGDFGSYEGKWPSPLPADKRRELLAKVPGWTEFSNAPQ